MNVLEAIDHEALFAPHFRGDSWRPWRAYLATLFSLPIDDDLVAIVESCTGRAVATPRHHSESWLICGRRSGKSRILALLAAFLSTLVDWKQWLAPGEVASMPVLAADRRQAAVIVGYLRALILETPALAALVVGETADTIALSTGVEIEVATNSFRTIRGRTVAAALLDETAFWRDETSANPGREVIAALKPAMATMPGAMMLCASSPYRKGGVLYDAYARHFGKPGNTLVWKAPSRVMNPALPQSVVDEAMDEDPASARAEFLGEFRDDLTNFISREVVEGAVERGLAVRPPQDGVMYHAFADPSGGSNDAMTLGIAHLEPGNVAVLDCLLERRPPFNPDVVVSEFSETLKNYRLTSCTGDRYAAQWVVAAFDRHGVTYRHSDRDRSAIYGDVLPLFTSGRARLLDVARLVGQFAGLERRTSPGGRDRVDHGPGAHDDLANSAAGALTLAAARPQKREIPITLPYVHSVPSTIPSGYRRF